MKEDYLWDGTGEVDSEIEQLEQKLGAFRFRNKPLAIRVAPTRRFNPYLAIAASIIFVLFAAGLFVVLRRNANDSRNPVVQNHESVPAPVPGNPSPSGGNENRQDQSGSKNTEASRTPAPERIVYAPVARRKSRRMSPEMIREGRYAKEQLLRALWIASEKINLAQKRIQVNRASGPAS
jgi:hypothetical protein